LSGAGWFRSLRTISIPLLVPTIMAATVYVFIRSFTELSASLLLFSYNTEPYSVAAFNIWSGGQVGETAAYGVVGITVMIVVIILGQVITRKRFLTSI
jgi:iron(III) transport system permease protein